MEIAGHIDVLERRESLRGPLVWSVVFHGTLFASLVAYASLGARARVLWGDPHSLGGGSSVGITPVSQIPLPSRGGAINPVANDSESNVPASPKPEPVKRVRAPEPDAIAIRGRKQAKSAPRAAVPPYKGQPATRSNQVYSSVGQALSSPMYGSQTGAGGVGVGPGSAFGNRFGYYRDLLEKAISMKWRTDDVDASLRTAPPVIVSFEILRAGQARDIRIMQGSGNRALDYSAQRAIYEASPFPPLPPGYDRDSARIEIWFQLKR